MRGMFVACGFYIWEDQVCFPPGGIYDLSSCCKVSVMIRFVSVSRRGFFSLIVYFCVAACFAVFTEQTSAQVTSQTFKLRYAWSYTSLSQVRGGIDKWPQATFQLNSNGTISTLTQSNVGTWSLVGPQITLNFAFNNGSSTYIGTRQTDGSFNGSMISGNGMVGVWKGSFYP